MGEQRAEYLIKEANPISIPARWLNFLYRIAGLQGGRIYIVAITIPSKADGEPSFAFLAESKVENGG